VNPVKVLMVTGAYYPEISSSGLQTQLIATAMGGAAEVQVLTTALDPATPNHSTVDGVAVTRIHVTATTSSKAAALVSMMPEMMRLVAWCDVVHIHGVSSKNIPLNALARMSGKPVVLSLHTMGADEPAIVRRSGPLAWWAFRSAARYLSVSEGLMQSFVADGLPADRIEQVGNGIDTDRFAPPSAEEKRRLRQQLGLDADRPLILFVGFFSQDKQPRVLFDAWLQLRDVHGIDATLVFLGETEDHFEVDGSIVTGMRADVDARGLRDRITFAGVVHNVHDYLRAADVFVLPSRREGMPVALLEAMSTGLPCVASRLPGATDTLIDDGVSGVLVPPGEANGFADAVRAVLADPDRAARMGAAARTFVLDHFSAPSIAAQWLANYRRVLRDSGVDRS
jgi:glycosyltransferase involved in cell wall biosynthesis